MSSQHRLPAPPAPRGDWALFLDVDGTLLDLAATPEGVHVAPSLLDDLQRLYESLDGALTLVSGRRVEALDTLFAPLQLPTIGLHGLQRRDGSMTRVEPPAAFPAVLAAARELAEKFPGALVEDKGVAIGLHWRNAPAAEEPLHEFATSALIELPGYGLQPGHAVLELRPDGHNKGDAIALSLREPLMRNRIPVFVGDDLTDEYGFDAVNAHDGISVLVGERSPTAARYGLHDPMSVRAWLRDGAAHFPQEARA